MHSDDARGAIQFGTGQTHGTSHVGWDTWESLGQSLMSHLGQWDVTNTWDKPCMMGHMGVPGTVPRTVSWDRNEGTHGSP